MCFLISIWIQGLKWFWFSLHLKGVLRYKWWGGAKTFFWVWNLGSEDSFGFRNFAVTFVEWKVLVWTFFGVSHFSRKQFYQFHIEMSWTGANYMQMTRVSRRRLLAELSWFCFKVDLMQRRKDDLGVKFWAFRVFFWGVWFILMGPDLASFAPLYHCYTWVPAGHCILVGIVRYFNYHVTMHGPLNCIWHNFC